MIAIRRVRAAALSFVALVPMLLAGCGGSEEEEAACAAVPGQATTSTGGSSINTYTLYLGSSGSIRFSTDNHSFFSGTVDTEIASVGPGCLDSVTSWPGGGVNLGYVPAVVGGVYAVRFTTRPGGITTVKHAKFIVDSYSGGVVIVTFVPNL